VLQDFMDQHFSQKSIGEIGSLYYIKEIFSHRSLKAAVMQNYQHVEDFIEVRNKKNSILCLTFASTN